MVQFIHLWLWSMNALITDWGKNIDSNKVLMGIFCFFLTFQNLNKIVYFGDATIKAVLHGQHHRRACYANYCPFYWNWLQTFIRELISCPSFFEKLVSHFVILSDKCNCWSLCICLRLFVQERNFQTCLSTFIWTHSRTQSTAIDQSWHRNILNQLQILIFRVTLYSH